MHLADAFIQSDLQCIQAINCLPVCVFPGNRCVSVSVQKVTLWRPYIEINGKTIQSILFSFICQRKSLNSLQCKIYKNEVATLPHIQNAESLCSYSGMSPPPPNMPHKSMTYNKNTDFYRTHRHPVWSSAAGAHLLQGSMCCVFRDGVLQILVVTSGYLSYCCLTIISNQSVHSPLTSDINKAFSSTQLPLTGYFLFFGPFSVNPRDGCVWKSQ